VSVQFSNDAYGVAVLPISESETEIEIVREHWGAFPDLDGEHFCYLSIIPRGERKTAEIVKATGFSNGIFTVERGVDGTTPTAHRRGARISMRLVSAALYAMKTDLRNEADKSNEEKSKKVLLSLLEQLSDQSDALTAEAPMIKMTDEISENSMNMQTIFLNKKLDALTCALSRFATQASV
jgi:hypothetical protein